MFIFLSRWGAERSERVSQLHDSMMQPQHSKVWCRCDDIIFIINIYIYIIIINNT